MRRAASRACVGHGLAARSGIHVVHSEMISDADLPKPMCARSVPHCGFGADASVGRARAREERDAGEDRRPGAARIADASRKWTGSDLHSEERGAAPLARNRRTLEVRHPRATQPHRPSTRVQPPRLLRDPSWPVRSTGAPWRERCRQRLTPAQRTAPPLQARPARVRFPDAGRRLADEGDRHPYPRSRAPRGRRRRSRGGVRS